MKEKKLSIACVSLLSVLALGACGGGGDSSSTTGSAEGVYKGTIANSSSASSFRAVVLEDGQYWTLYGNDVGGGFAVSGLIQGQGVSSNGTFKSSNLKDFGSRPSAAGSLDLTYVPGTSISGTASSGSGSVTLSGDAVPKANFDYDAAPSISNLVGAWSLSSTSGNTLAVSIEADGDFTGTDQVGCTLAGNIKPRPSGKNIFDVQIKTGPAPCPVPNLQGSGIGLYTTTDGKHQLIVTNVDVTRSYGSAVFGTR